MPQNIRLCTWNIQMGLHLEMVLDAVKARADFNAIDLLALQEASIHSNEEDADRIAAALGPEYAAYQMIAHSFGHLAQANAVVWNTARFQVMRKHILPLPHVLMTRPDFAERTLLHALPQQRRMSIVLDGTIGGESLRLYIAHLDVLGWVHKWEQFNAILSDAQTRQPAVSVCLVAGDLNTFRFASRSTRAAMTQAANQGGLKDLTTGVHWTHQAFRRLPFRQKLDAIWGRSARPMTYRAWSVDVAGSDHIPVFTDITLL